MIVGLNKRESLADFLARVKSQSPEHLNAIGARLTEELSQKRASTRALADTASSASKLSALTGFMGAGYVVGLSSVGLLAAPVAATALIAAGACMIAAGMLQIAKAKLYVKSNEDDTRLLKAADFSVARNFSASEGVEELAFSSPRRMATPTMSM